MTKNKHFTILIVAFTVVVVVVYFIYFAGSIADLSDYSISYGHNGCCVVVSKASHC